MGASTARTEILRLFRHAGPRDPDEPISFATIRDALAPEYTKGTVSARLSELVDEGILEKSSRGQYRLAYTEEEIPDALREIVDLLTERLASDALQGTIVWDATPVLADSEDGVMAPVRVVETERFTGGSTARTILDYWPGEETPHVEEFADRITLLETVFGTEPAMASADEPQVLVGPAESKYAATTLNPEGIRLATPERVLADLLNQSDPSAGEIARVRLTASQANLDPERLFSAAEERDLLADLFAVLSRHETRIPDQLREAYRQRLRPASRAATEDRPL